MTCAEPTGRPDAVMALALWRRIRETVGIVNWEWRPRPRQEHFIGSVIFDAAFLERIFMSFAGSLVKRIAM